MTALRSEASVGTIVPERYLAQLCAHFSAGGASESGCEGRAEFEGATCSIHSSARALMLVVEAEDEISLARVQHIVSSYLERAMWREQPSITWVRKGGYS